METVSIISKVITYITNNALTYRLMETNIPYNERIQTYFEQSYNWQRFLKAVLSIIPVQKIFLCLFLYFIAQYTSIDIYTICPLLLLSY